MDIQFIQSTLISLFLGSIIGLERQWHRRLVDLKTNALVSLGSCLFMLVTVSWSAHLDFVRMGGQIVVGVGFIGGGLLFREGSQTKGINTAATLWCCAAVGILCGMNRWSDAAIATLTIVAANTILRQIAQFLNLKMGTNDSLTETVKISATCKKMNVEFTQTYIIDFFERHHLDINAFELRHAENNLVSLGYTVLFEQGQFNSSGRKILAKLDPPDMEKLTWLLS